MCFFFSLLFPRFAMMLMKHQSHMGSLVTIADKNYFTSWAMALVTSLVVWVFVYSCAWNILWSSACHTFTTLQSVVADFPPTAECLKLYFVKTPHWDYCVTRVNKDFTSVRGIRLTEKASLGLTKQPSWPLAIPEVYKLGLKNSV